MLFQQHVEKFFFDIVVVFSLCNVLRMVRFSDFRTIFLRYLVLEQRQFALIEFQSVIESFRRSEFDPNLRICCRVMQGSGSPAYRSLRKDLLAAAWEADTSGMVSFFIYLLVHYTDSFRKNRWPLIMGLVFMPITLHSLVVDRLQITLQPNFEKLDSSSIGAYSHISGLSYVFPSTKHSSSPPVRGAFTIWVRPIYECSYVLPMEAGAFVCLTCAIFWQPTDQSSVANLVSSGLYAITPILVLIPGGKLNFTMLDRLR